ncbi:Tm-1-like ATP-binding domain-containing protein [Celeribacter sp.]|uniref:Tm-1-like ATP-binding domain-containing protein n=1 Tax=Celeribacter sp. TaxID=1890673 RepID=UPI003A94B918
MTVTQTMQRILLIGTADTKADELSYLQTEIARLGHRALIMDVGVLGVPKLPVDHANHEVAKRAEMRLSEVAALGDECKAMEVMAEGAARLASDLYLAGQIDGALAIGGTMGTDLALEVMSALPIGVPKLIVSSVAFSHIIPPERIAPDLMMILWAGGLWGLNSDCKAVLNQAAGAVVGAATAMCGVLRSDARAIAISSLGGSCLRYIGHLKPELEARGYEVVIFHTVGMGGRTLEGLVAQGRFAAVLDLSLIEVSNHALGSPVHSGADRLETAGRLGVPQIVAPGAIDSVDDRAWDGSGRSSEVGFHAHNRLIGGIATGAADKIRIAEIIAQKLSISQGPTAFVMPRLGVNEWDRPGQDMHDPEGLAQFEATLSAALSGAIEMHSVDHHINDAEFSQAILAIFDEWCRQGLIAPAQDQDQKKRAHS